MSDEEKIFLTSLVRETTKETVLTTLDTALKEVGIRPKTRKSKVSLSRASYLTGISRYKIQKAIDANKVDIKREEGQWRYEVVLDSVQKHFGLQ